MKISNEIATVVSNKMIADNIYEAFLKSPNISKYAKPGQFINILPSKDWQNVMRRPMSIASQDNNQISIIYKVFGSGTEIISNWKDGDKVDIIGPLGNNWSDFENKLPVLIGGGVGIAPILNLHNHLNNLGIKNILICGAKTKNEHFLEHNPSKGLYMSTDTESFGIQGNVIYALESIMDTINSDIKIFSCGPHGMLQAIYNYSKEMNYECDLALETIMACGIGICQGCAIEKECSDSENTYRNKFALACIDGPIFSTKELSDAF